MNKQHNISRTMSYAAGAPCGQAGLLRLVAMISRHAGQRNVVGRRCLPLGGAHAFHMSDGLGLRGARMQSCHSKLSPVAQAVRGGWSRCSRATCAQGVCCCGRALVPLSPHRSRPYRWDVARRSGQRTTARPQVEDTLNCGINRKAYEVSTSLWRRAWLEVWIRWRWRWCGRERAREPTTG